MTNFDISKKINDIESAPFVIAEIGINHNGSFDTAKKLIDGSKKAGAHGIKFQYRNLENAYSLKSNQIGDEILKHEINKNYLPPNEIIQLLDYAKRLELKVGISFFARNDALDFLDHINKFDFFKIPSVELMNLDLLTYLNQTGVPLFVSTGAHFEFEIEYALSLLQGENWYPLHCISNYPVSPHNSNFAYIKTLRDKYRRQTGLSSHEKEWESVLISLKYGPRIIERHISVDTNSQGLDQTSSSSIQDFTKMVQLINDYFSDLTYDKNIRIPNQGEMINRQNLGRSFYVKKSFKSGSEVNLNDLDYRSPNVGLGFSPRMLKNAKLVRDIDSGSAISESYFMPEVELEDFEIEFANKFNLAIPVRLYDFEAITKRIPVRKIELHLSYGEVDAINNMKIDFKNYELSVHLPDYISPLQLIDPYSDNIEIFKKSNDIIEKVKKFVLNEQDKCGSKIDIVGSFSNVSAMSTEEYYKKYAELIHNMQRENIFLSLQWLPPFAWYFGGSQRINIMNSENDLGFIDKYNIPVCLDISHLILGSNYFGFKAEDVVQIIRRQISFFHVSDASGIDGEGHQFNCQESPNNKLFQSILSQDKRKTIEVWQGHLENAKGFKLAIKELYRIHREKS